jgi:hypothetical protein
MTEINLEYQAITIDTCIFDERDCGLEKGLLKQLYQFKGSPVVLVLSEIVIRELQKHMTEKIKDSRAKIGRAMKLASAHLCLAEVDADQICTKILGIISDSALAKQRIHEFITNTGAKIIVPELATMDSLVSMYFDISPPFKNIDNKKHEFPDAIALLSLEAWADDNNVRLLAVSKDNGWKEYAEGSTSIVVIEDLTKAMAEFQTPNAVRSIVELLISSIDSETDNDILFGITDELTKSLLDVDIEIEAYSAFSYETEDVYAKYLGHDFVRDSSSKSPIIEVIRVDQDCVVLQVEVDVTCEVFCTFELSVYDGVDREDVHLGKNSASVIQEYSTGVLLTLVGDFAKGLEFIEL